MASLHEAFNEPFTEERLRRLVDQEVGTAAGVLRPAADATELSLMDGLSASGRNAGFGFVYVFKGTHGGVSRYKIGKANRIADRRKVFEVKLPFDIDLVAAFRVADPLRLERDAHRLFADCRVGGEWFDLSPEGLDRLVRLGVARELADMADCIEAWAAESMAQNTLSDADYIAYLEAMLVMHGIAFDGRPAKKG